MEPLSPISRTTRRRLNILVVDDEPLICRTVQRSLSDDSHDVISATDAAQAQSLLRERHVDVIVLDVNLKSEPDGFGFLDMLKKDFSTSGIPVVMVTGDRRADLLPRARAMGAADCLQKPLNYESLKARLVELVTKTRRAPKATQNSYGDSLVLHVEDDPEWADLVRGWLAGKGFSLHRVANRSELLRFLEAGPQLPDCLILDLGLEGIDGFDVCDELKAHPVWRKIPVLVLTSREDRRVAGFQHQALNLVSKLAKDAGEELVAALRAVVAQQKCAADVFESGDIRLEPSHMRIFHRGKLLCVPEARLFAIIRLLMEHSPLPVPEAEIRAVCVRHREKSGLEPADSRPNTIQVYISNLRRLLGKDIGARIICIPKQGYSYIPPSGSSS